MCGYLCFSFFGFLLFLRTKIVPSTPQKKPLSTRQCFHEQRKGVKSCFWGVVMEGRGLCTVLSAMQAKTRRGEGRQLFWQVACHASAKNVDFCVWQLNKVLLLLFDIVGGRMNNNCQLGHIEDYNCNIDLVHCYRLIRYMCNLLHWRRAHLNLYWGLGRQVLEERYERSRTGRIKELRGRALLESMQEKMRFVTR